MKINKFKNSLIFKVMCFLLIFSMLPWNVCQPTTVKADSTGGHQSYFVETLLDDNGQYVAKVINDSNNFGDGAEENRMKEAANIDGDEKYLNWTQYSIFKIADNKRSPFSYGTKLVEADKKGSLIDDTGLIFSFPSYQRANNDSGGYLKDQDRAITVSKTLTANLNALVSSVKDKINLSKDYDISSLDIEKQIADTIEISRRANPTIQDKEDAGTGFFKVSIGNVLDIYYANTNKYDTYMNGGGAQTDEIIINDKSYEVQAIDKNGNLLMYILSPNQTISSEGDLVGSGIVWAMPKGYLNPISDEKEKHITKDSPYNMWGVANDKSAYDKGDAVWITIFTLAEYANAQAIVRDYTLIDSSTEDTNFVESTIYGFFMNIYGGLLNLLQLKTIPELIYGEGLMSDSWWNVVLKYHLIFQIVAWMMLIVAISKILIQINFSTVNPTIKMSIMDTGQKLLTVGFALALCIPFIRMLEELNRLIVNIFQTQAFDEDSMLAGFGFAGLVILFGYFGITFTMNCIYIMRAIMVALLASSAPLFITSMAFSGPKQKGLMDNWLKEISANIFMQSIHAFAFAFLFDVMGASNLMIRLVIYFSLLPIVDSFRQLVFGQSGGFAVSQGQKAAQTVGAFMENTAGGVAKGTGNLAMGLAAKKMKLDAKTTDDVNAGGKTSGENKAGTVGGNLQSNAQKVASALKGKDNKFAQAAGVALSGASKAADLYKSTGGIMGNAVTQANLGQVGESVKASQSYGEGVAVNTERTGHDIANTAGAISKAKNEKGEQKAIADEQYWSGKETQAKQQLSAAQARGADKDVISHYQQQVSSANRMKGEASNKVNKFQKNLGKNASRQGLVATQTASGTSALKAASSEISTVDGKAAVSNALYQSMMNNNRSGFDDLDMGSFQYDSVNDVWKSEGTVVKGSNGTSMIVGHKENKQAMDKSAREKSTAASMQAAAQATQSAAQAITSASSATKTHYDAQGNITGYTK